MNSEKILAERPISPIGPPRTGEAKSVETAMTGSWRRVAERSDADGCQRYDNVDFRITASQVARAPLK